MLALPCCLLTASHGNVWAAEALAIAADRVVPAFVPFGTRSHVPRTVSLSAALLPCPFGTFKKSHGTRAERAVVVEKRQRSPLYSGFQPIHRLYNPEIRSTTAIGTTIRTRSGCTPSFSICPYLPRSKPIPANTMPTNQNEVTTFHSDQPDSSKWWWIGLILKIRLPRSLNEPT